jgi:hypothetical protein
MRYGVRRQLTDDEADVVDQMRQIVRREVQAYEVTRLTWTA